MAWLDRYISVLTVLLLSYLVTAHPSPRDDNTKEFDLTVSWEDHAPDGFSRKMLLVNGQTPGPVLEFNQGNCVVVNVQNKSPYNITVHFHGLEMKGTPWSDGVPGVTQRPILPGKSFTHRFDATQYGSFWYHSHFLGQIEDGLYGPVVIHPRDDQPKPFAIITDDKNTLLAMDEAEKHVFPLVISDFVHLTSQEKWDMALAAGVEDSCYDSILFNGKGKVYCLPEKEITANLNPLQKLYLSMVPGSAFTDKACLPASILIAIGGGQGNESALLPGSFSGCKDTNGPIEVVKAFKPSCSPEQWTAIDIIGGINFVSGVVSIDEHDMWVYAMDGSYIEPQKVQAIPITNGDRYSVLVKTDRAGDYKIRFSANSAPQIIAGHALLSVDGKGHDAESKAYIDVAGLPVDKQVAFFNQSIAHPFPPDPPALVADRIFNLSMKPDGASYLWALNHTRLMPQLFDLGEPVLFHPDPNLQNNVTISTNLNDWVDLVFIASVFPQPPHPIHKHGTKMYHIGSGKGAFRWSSVAEAVKEVPGQFNLVNPPRRDAFTSLPAEDDASWVVVRYHATDPGAWLLHCHINNHMVGGMMMVIQDGVDAWPEVPAEYVNYGA